jgi:TRAP-type C4-dicarboxylate transport system substrate-binding protein
MRLIEYVVMSRSFYESLAAEDRAVIDRAARAMILQQRSWYRAEADSALERLLEQGVRITRPDREPFRAAARSLHEEWAESVGGMQRIEAILDMGGVGRPRDGDWK